MPVSAYEGKKIHYEDLGSGQAVIFCHGNTASSKMFSFLMPLYQEHFRCLLIDFLGHGLSDRLDSFPTSLWIHEARQVKALVEHLALDEVSLIGTSGGAWVTLNAALLMPGRISAVVADSFDGLRLHDGFVPGLLAERQAAMADEAARGFYEWCLGSDWKDIVEMDTKALCECAESGMDLFVAPLQDLHCPVLLTGSEEDSMCRPAMEAGYMELEALMDDVTIHMFPQGGHPAILSNAEDFARCATTFIKRHRRRPC